MKKRSLLFALIMVLSLIAGCAASQDAEKRNEKNTDQAPGVIATDGTKQVSPETLEEPDVSVDVPATTEEQIEAPYEPAVEHHLFGAGYFNSAKSAEGTIVIRRPYDERNPTIDDGGVVVELQDYEDVIGIFQNGGDVYLLRADGSVVFYNPISKEVEDSVADIIRKFSNSDENYAQYFRHTLENVADICFLPGDGYHWAILHNDGTVSMISNTVDSVTRQIAEWTNIKYVTIGGIMDYILGVTEEGKVQIACEEEPSEEQAAMIADAMSWTGIKKIMMVRYYAIIGLTEDGRILVAGNSDYQPTRLTNVKDIAAGDDEFYFLLENGEVYHAMAWDSDNLDEIMDDDPLFTDILEITDCGSVYRGYLAALSSDGSVYVIDHYHNISSFPMP